MTVKMIVAVDRGNAIGWSDGRLPWKIPGDLKRFKALTIQSTVLMGRKTFESLNRPEGLPERNNLVMSSTMPRNRQVNVINAPLEDAVKAHQVCLGCEPEDLWIIGGASVYAEAIEKQLVDEIYLTLVHENSGADVVLPFDLAAWKLFILQQEKIGVKWYLAAIEDGPTCTFITLKR
jgi:dihydrofolate reductase